LDHLQISINVRRCFRAGRVAERLGSGGNDDRGLEETPVKAGLSPFLPLLL
jgi:hypothetical protein